MPAIRRKQKWYAVVKGRSPGVYDNWGDARNQVDGFPGAVHKSFGAKDEAMRYFTARCSGLYPQLPEPESSAPASSDDPPSQDFDYQPSEPLRPTAFKSAPAPASSDDPPSQDFGYQPPEPLRPTAFKSAPAPASSDDPPSRDFGCQPPEPLRPTAFKSAPAPDERESLVSSYRVIGSGGSSGNPATPKKPKIKLAPEQQKVLEAALGGENVFFTGPAGTGKSLVIEHIKWRLHKQHIQYAVTAPTGIAAVLLGGSTIHSWSGVGKGDEGTKTYIRKSQARATQIGRKTKSWRQTSVLIIDEISMLNAGLWETLDAIARQVRGSPSQFFGGMQVIVCGDFYQLPPVITEKDGPGKCNNCAKPFAIQSQRDYMGPPEGMQVAIGVNQYRFHECAHCGYIANDTIKYTFQTPTWTSARFRTIILSEIYRQKDQLWITMLNKIKIANVDMQVLNFLSRLQRPLEDIDGVKATKLYTHRASVEQENLREFNLLPSAPYLYNAIDTGSLYDAEGINIQCYTQLQLADKFFFRHLHIPEELSLKVDAQVMLLSNISPDKQLVNGTRGVVADFVTLSMDELMTLDADGDRQTLLSFFEVNADKATQKITLPRFKFAALNSTKDKDYGQEPYIVLPISRTHQNILPDGNSEVLERIQLPFALAWATTVHKAQGMTLDYATVDIEKAFAPGQAYVGLSRCRHYESLQVTARSGREGLKRAIQCDDTVKEFYRQLDMPNPVLYTVPVPTKDVIVIDDSDSDEDVFHEADGGFEEIEEEWL